jgi:hypothetical protein
MSVLRRRVQAGPAAMRRNSTRRANKIGVIGKQSANGIDVAFGTRIEELSVSACLASLNFSFQCPPTRESVIPRDSELS